MTERKFRLGCALWIVYFVMGLVQLKAICDGLNYFLDWPHLFVTPLAVILAYIPVLGSVCGVIGAYLAWHWDVLPALLLFFWYPLLFFVIWLVFRGVCFFQER